MNANGSTYIYYNGSSRLETTSSGAQIKGNGGMFTLLGTDHSYIQFYPDGSGAGRKAYVGQGSASNDGFTIANESSDADIVIKVKDGSSTLSAMIFDASNYGRVILPNDNQKLTIGAGYDLNLYNNGSVSYIANSNNTFNIDQGAAANMQIRNLSSDQDILFSVNDGGSQITALQIDSSDAGSAIFSHDVKVNDNGKLKAGDGNDFHFTHDGSNNYIMSNTSDQDLYIRVNDGGSMLTAIRTDTSDTAAVKLPNDGQKLTLGASDDLRLQHNGTHSFIQAYGTGDLYLDNNNDDQSIVFRTDDGSGGVQTFLKLDGANNMVRVPTDGVKLTLGADSDLQVYHVGSTNYLRANTSDQDLHFLVNDGGSTLTAMKIDSSEVARVQFQNDNQVVAIGASDDLQFYHDGSHSYIDQVGTGNLYIRNTVDDKHIDIQTDDGSGGVTTYMRFKGDENLIRTFKNFRLHDSNELQVGTSSDLSILHNGTDSKINNYTGAFYITQHLDDGDIYLRADDGSGGVTPYLTLDGSAGNLNFNNKALVAIGGIYGNSGTLNMYNDTYYFKNASSGVIMSLNGSTLDLPNTILVPLYIST